MVAPITCPGGQAGVGRGRLFNRAPVGLKASSPSVGVGVGVEGVGDGAAAASIGDGSDEGAGAEAGAGAGAGVLFSPPLLLLPLLEAAFWGTEAAANVC